MESNPLSKARLVRVSDGKRLTLREQRQLVRGMGFGLNDADRVALAAANAKRARKAAKLENTSK